MLRSRSSVRLQLGLLLAIVVAGMVLGGASPAGAQADENVPTEENAPVDSLPGIIPEPNSGREPEVEGDPGSLTQYLVMAGIFGGLAVIGLLIVRESRTKKAAQEARLSTRNEPVDETSENSPDSTARQ